MKEARRFVSRREHLKANAPVSIPMREDLSARAQCPVPDSLDQLRERLEGYDGGDLERPERPEKRPKLNHSFDESTDLHHDDGIVMLRRDLTLSFRDTTNSERPVSKEDQCHRISVDAHVTQDWAGWHIKLSSPWEELLDCRLNFEEDTKDTRQCMQYIELAGREGLMIHRSDRRGRLQCILLIPRAGSCEVVRLQLRAMFDPVEAFTDIHPNIHRQKAGLHLLGMFQHEYPQLRGLDRDRRLPWSPQIFYNNLYVPDDLSGLPPNTAASNLRCTLYPFQQRTVRWLLHREGVDVNKNGALTLYERNEHPLPLSFHEVADADGRSCFISPLYLVGARSLTGFTVEETELRGGILAEEMGLGKTVELIALICLHRRASIVRPAESSDDRDLKPAKGTLIITPPAILQQWKDELATHAPFLKVLHYRAGRHREKVDGFGEDAKTNELLEYDVVLTTYLVLSREVHNAAPPPERNLRHAKRYEPRRSPLVMLEWWRVCLDEAQMIESGVSNAAFVARVIPRCNAWAVSGTPVKKDSSDVLGLLLFLNYQPLCNTGSELWSRLYREFPEYLQTLLGNIALRHTKDHIRNELTLPPQKRVVITVPFSQIEEQHYSHLFQQMCDDVGLDREGGPIRGDWSPNSADVIEKMRVWLMRLRQTCLHPEVGYRNRRALGQLSGALRTVEEVLEVMIDQNENASRQEERNLQLLKVKRGQIFESRQQSREALNIWLSVLNTAQNTVKMSRAGLQVEISKLKSLQKDRKDSVDSANDDTAPSESRQDLLVDTDSENEQSDTDKAEEKAAKEAKAKVTGLRNRLRTALELEHIVTFFVANAYFQIKSNEEVTKLDSEEFKQLEAQETETYDRAKFIRNELLSEIRRKVGRLMKTLSRNAESQSFLEIPEIKVQQQGAGIESRKLAEQLQLLGDVLNDQANELDEWREIMVQLLIQPLVDEDEEGELQGDEYERSTKHQDEVYIYMEAIRAAVADRHDALTGEVNSLIAKEMEDALKNAGEGMGPYPELLKRILATRLEIKPSKDLGSLRQILSSLRSHSSSLRLQDGAGAQRARVELAIIEALLKQAQSIWSDQIKAVSGLEREIDLFRNTMNTRLEFYRQLQQISDTVEPYEKEADVDEDELLESIAKQEQKTSASIATFKSKGNYLQNLRTENSDKTKQRICVICQNPFEIGALTVCGHQYCKECIGIWWSQHRSCPVCKKHLSVNDFHQITYKPKELQVQEETAHSDVESTQSSPISTSIYSGISQATLNEIKNVEVQGSFGTKIDTLARHLLWLRQNDPGAKSIVFSQYRDFLGVISRAFTHFGIGHASIDKKDGIEDFKSNPRTECFLLHAKAHASGLNLVNATHVFLSEPLVNTALELQAIARVHRIGQQLPTTVWMYLVNDTVEESIYELSVNRRLEHIGKQGKSDSGRATPAIQQTTLDAANSAELQQANLSQILAKGQKDGEMVKQEDLWKCLFGKPQKSAATWRKAEADPEIARNLRAHVAETRQEKVVNSRGSPEY